MNQNAPSGPTVIHVGTLLLVGIGKSVTGSARAEGTHDKLSDKMAEKNPAPAHTDFGKIMRCLPIGFVLVTTRNAV